LGRALVCESVPALAGPTGRADGVGLGVGVGVGVGVGLALGDLLALGDVLWIALTGRVVTFTPALALAPEVQPARAASSAARTAIGTMGIGLTPVYRLLTREKPTRAGPAPRGDAPCRLRGIL
jgi:hypothetical protein